MSLEPLRRFAVLLLLATSVAAEASSADTTALLTVMVRDSRTGLGVPGVVADTLLREVGARQIEVRAEGYRPLRTRVDLREGEPLELTVWLDPIETEAATLAALAGQALVHGTVFDETSGLPLADVRVRLEGARAEAISDASGAFALETPAPIVNVLAEPPTSDVLVASRPGYATTRVAEVLLAEGTTRVSIGLVPGDGTRVQGERHKLRRSARELAEADVAPAVLEPTRGELAEGAVVRALPDSIRVGFGCSCASCTSVQVFSLDSYVRLGLDDEWIASWHEEALKAGAVAYRSYGAWHVAHPRAANYDICSTTCCQVIDPLDSSTRVDAAVARTQGQLLVDAAGAPFFAEYSAENNDASCPDGSAGRPAQEWPCLADSVDAGATFSGHGRGMCQWGTQRWATRMGRDYLWIVDHYYNDNGRPSGRRSGRLVTAQRGDFSIELRPTSARVRRGRTARFEVWVTARDGFDGPVALSVAGAPSGATPRLSLSVIQTSGMSVLTVATSRRGPLGTFPLTVTGQSDELRHETVSSLTVTR